MLFRFGPYSLDSDRAELVRGLDVVSVEPQVFSVLLYLIENRHRVVSKDDLIDGVWEGRIVSDAALSTRINGARRAVGDNGKDQSTIRTLPRRGFRFVAEVIEETVSSSYPDEAHAPPLPDKPSIAVLPFANLGGDAEQEYFSDGVTEDIITALSNVRSFLVIARNSSFTFKGRDADVHTVGRDLGVHYVLQGSVRKSGDRVRVSAQLTEAATAANIWADRFDGVMDDIFDLQDRITESVIGAIEPELLKAELARIKQKRPEHLDAYDLTLRGLAMMNRLTPETTAEALRLFHAATNVDPNFGRAYVCASWCHRREVQLNGLVIDDEQKREGVRLAERALDADPTDPYILWQAGLTFALIENDLDRALRLIEQSLSINANSTRGWIANGMVRNFMGLPEGAIDAAHRAIRLSPLETAMWVAHGVLALAQFQLSDYEAAARWARLSVEKHRYNLPAYHALIAALAKLGESEEAERWTGNLLALDPETTVARIRILYPVSRYRNAENFFTGLKAAGLREE